MGILLPKHFGESDVPVLNYMGGVGSAPIIDLRILDDRCLTPASSFVITNPPYFNSPVDQFQADLLNSSLSDHFYPELLENVLARVRENSLSLLSLICISGISNLDLGIPEHEWEVSKYLLENLPLSISFILEHVVENPPDKGPWTPPPFISPYGFTLSVYTTFISQRVHHTVQRLRFIPYKTALEQFSTQPTHHKNSSLQADRAGRQAESANLTRASKPLALPLRQ